MNKVKIIIITTIIVSIIAVGAGCYIVWDKQNKEKILADMKINFKQNVKYIEYGDEVQSKSFIKDSIGEVTTFPNVDTKTVGKQMLTYKLAYKGVIKDISYEILIKDTKAPIINIKKEKVILPYGKKFTEQDNIDKVYDIIDGEYKVAKEKKKGSYWIESSLDTKKAGTYTVIVHAEDRNGNDAKKSYKIIVEKKEEQKKDDMLASKTPIISDKKESNNKTTGSGTTQPYYVNGVLLVNKKHALPREYKETDSRAYTALQSLQRKAKSAGYNIPLISGYRSYDYQENLYNSYIAQDGQELADTYSARPESSEHQTGLAFDIGSLDNSYGDTQAGKWLDEHCAKYGFILRYPKGKESITGYQYEPWHVCYVGVEIASQIMTQGITLEEYLGDL